MTDHHKNIDESILIGKTLSLIAFCATASLEKFSSWLLAGFGAAFALILSNIDSVSKLITPANIKCGVSLYLIALAAGVLQRWLASSTQASAMASKEAETLGKNAPSTINQKNFLENLLLEIENVTFYPQKWLVQYQLAKVRKGDFAAPGRMQALMAQIQGYLVLAQGALAISSIFIIIMGISLS